MYMVVVKFVRSFRLKNQTSKNIADTTFNIPNSLISVCNYTFKNLFLINGISPNEILKQKF